MHDYNYARKSNCKKNTKCEETIHIWELNSLNSRRFRCNDLKDLVLATSVAEQQQACRLRSA